MALGIHLSPIKGRIIRKKIRKENLLPVYPTPMRNQDLKKTQNNKYPQACIQATYSTRFSVSIFSISKQQQQQQESIQRTPAMSTTEQCIPTRNSLKERAFFHFFHRFSFNPTLQDSFSPYWTPIAS